MFSIIIPSWNNLALLKLCIASIRQNSSHIHQIIVHVNEGKDGTLDWVKAEGIAHTASPHNIGVCYATNQAAMLATGQYIVFMNDDMYCCPQWDTAILETISQLNTSLFLLSARMIEPSGKERLSRHIKDFGSDAASFQEAALLAYIKQLHSSDFNGTAQPTVLSREWWCKVGGYSIEFDPGMGSDVDLMMKLWFAGCRIFRGVGHSLVYHFKQKTTGRIIHNNSRIQFMRKWGISTRMFHHDYVRSDTPVTTLAQPEPRRHFKYYFDLCRVRLVLLTSWKWGT